MVVCELRQHLASGHESQKAENHCSRRVCVLEIVLFCIELYASIYITPLNWF